VKILFVHITDIHWRVDKAIGVKRAKKLVDIVSSNNSYEFGQIVLVVSGDLAWSGRKEQYEQVSEFLGEVYEGLNKNFPKTPITKAVCPGNHDCDFSEPKEVREVVKESWKCASKKSFKGEFFDLLITPQKAYHDFESKYLDAQIRKPLYGPDIDERLGYRELIKVDGYKIRIRSINTSWLSELKEQSGQLYLPSVFEKYDDGQIDLDVTLCHHPLVWLEANSAHEVRGALLKNTDILFTGHEHSGHSFQLSELSGNRSMHLVEGPAFSDHTDDNSSEGFSLVSFDPKTKEIEQNLFYWNGNGYSTSAEGESRSTDLSLGIATRADGPLTLQYKFDQWLRDPQLSIVKQSSKIQLEQIYVLPECRELNVDINGTGKKPSPAKTITIERVLEKYVTIFLGSDNSGKTALAKILFLELSARGHAPVYVSGGSSAMRKGHWRKSVDQAIVDQYSSDQATKYSNTPNGSKVFILDNYQNLSLKVRKDHRLLSELKSSFGHIVIFGHETEISPIELVDFVTSNDIGGVSIQSLQPLSFIKRDELVRKWINIDLDEKDPSFSLKLSDAHRKIDTIVGRNFVQPYPVYVLAVLLGSEAGGDFDMSASTHGHLYEVFIKAALAKRSTATNYNIFSNFLALLAYKAFSEEKDSFSEDFFRRVFADFEEEYEIDRNIKDFLEDLVSIGLLVRNGGHLVFSERFVSYYFVAYYIKDRLHKKHAQDLILEYSSKLWVEAYANVMMFLVHLSKDPRIFTKIVDQARSSFDECAEANLDSDLSFLGKINVIPVEIEGNGEPSRSTQTEALQQNSAEAVMPEYLMAPPRDVDPKNVDLLANINAAIKTMQLLGQVLKNFPASFDKDEKGLMVNECIGVGLRTLKRYYILMDDTKAEVAKEIAQMISGRGRIDCGPSDEETVEQAKRFVRNLSMISTFGLLKRVSYAIGSKELNKTYLRVFEGDTNSARELIHLSLMLDHAGRFPEEHVCDLVDKYMKNNPFCVHIARSLVMRHFKIFNVGRRTRQRVSERIGISYKESFIEGNKTKLLSNGEK